MMNRTTSFWVLMVLLLSLQSCFDPSKPNYQYFPNMYEPVGYETYADSDAFANGIEAQLPVEGSITEGGCLTTIPTVTRDMNRPKQILKSPIEILKNNAQWERIIRNLLCRMSRKKR